MQRILVTGANKGIGLAIVKQLLESGAFVFLGARDSGRGKAAADAILAADPKRAKQLQVVQLDVSDDASVAAAVSAVSATIGANGALHGLVNNAGGAASMNFTNTADFTSTIALNLHGTRRVTEAFLPFLTRADGGRIVMVSSGAAPSFVAKCSAARQQTLCDSGVTWEHIAAFVAEATSIAESVAGASDDEAKAAFTAAGFGEGAPYGLSKACMTSYAMSLASRFPKLKVNACSPGFIETDLTRPFAVKYNKSPAEMGMLPVDKGASCPCFLAIGDVPTVAGEAWYYGSDSQRSPLDKYRSPGDPPYTGGDSTASGKELLDGVK